MAQNMGISWAFNKVFKRKFRWLFFIPGVVDDGIKALPPLSGSRPSIKFEQVSIQHLTETIYFPGRPSYDPITLSLYDVQTYSPVWDWILLLYDPYNGTYKRSTTQGGLDYSTYKTNCYLSLYDGCGEEIERWYFEAAWCESANFGPLNMNETDSCMVDITLRFDRAYRMQSQSSFDTATVGGPGSI